MASIGRKVPPFSKGSEGYTRLTQLIENGTVGAETAPKAAYSLDPIFKDYNLSAFRAGLNKLKSEMGMMLRPTLDPLGELQQQEHTEILFMSSTNTPIMLYYFTLLLSFYLLEIANIVPLSIKRKFDGSGPNCGSLATVFDTVAGKPECTPQQNPYGNSDPDEMSIWVPIHFKTSFEDDKLRKRMSVMTCLPSGITKMTSLSAKVTDDGTILKVMVAVPNAVSEPSKFLRFCTVEFSRNGEKNRHFEKSSEFRLRAFHKALSICRESAGDVVWRTFSCPLDFQCMEDFNLVEMVALEGSYYLYIELFAKEKHLYMDDNGRLGGNVLDMNHMFW
jgi:hypothetical protein